MLCFSLKATIIMGEPVTCLLQCFWCDASQCLWTGSLSDLDLFEPLRCKGDAEHSLFFVSFFPCTDGQITFNQVKMETLVTSQLFTKE